MRGNGKKRLASTDVDRYACDHNTRLQQRFGRNQRRHMTTGKWDKSIIHLDMDSFYPSVEVLDNPRLKGKPVIVGGGKERGVVSSASYEARKFGVHSAQPISKAMRLCPSGVFLPPRMSRYQEISRKVFRVFRRFTPLVEPVSIDEAFLDVTGSIRLFGSPEEMAVQIKDMVRRKTGLTASAGVAPSKFVAKIASDMDKPDGLTIVFPQEVQPFLEVLPISKMWGVGKKTQGRFRRLGIRTIGDLKRFPIELLKKRFGRHGSRMHRLALGIDDREVVAEIQAKSIGHERTFSRDIHHLDSARKEIRALSGKVARRMRKKGVQGKTVTLKVKYSDFSQITRSVALSELSDDESEIFSVACDLLAKTDIGTRPVRLLGVTVSQLGRPLEIEQLMLFGKKDRKRKRKELNSALDDLSERFGEDSVFPATLLKD